MDEPAIGTLSQDLFIGRGLALQVGRGNITIEKLILEKKIFLRLTPPPPPPAKAEEIPEGIKRLAPKSQFLPAIGREVERQENESWLTATEPISIRVLTGRAGIGKTRLAVELCHFAKTKGWQAGFVQDDEPERFLAQPDLRGWEWERPTLMVFDYAAEQAPELHRFFKSLINRRNPAGFPLRILLLERYADTDSGWWISAFGRGGAVADAIQELLQPEEPVALNPLPSAGENATRWNILRTMQLRCGVSSVPDRPDEPLAKLLTHAEWAGEPLFLMMAGLLAAEPGRSISELLTIRRTELAFELASRERRQIASPAGDDADLAFLLEWMAVIATLCGGLSPKKFIDAVHREKEQLGYGASAEPAKLLRLLRERLPGRDGGVATVLPDIIGEALVLKVLGSKEVHTRPLTAAQTERSRQMIFRTFNQNPAPVTATVVRCVQDFAHTGHLLPVYWIDHLVRQPELPLETAMALADKLPHASFILAGLTLQVHRTLENRFNSLVKQDLEHPLAPYWATSLNNLAKFLRELGRREEALDAAQEAMGIRRQLAAARPDAFLPDLAMSLNNLATFLSELGRREEALDAAQEAMGIYRQLAAARPDAFLTDLAMSLNNLANRLSELGRREEALDAAQEAVATLKPFFLAQPLAFTPWMMVMLRVYLSNCESLKQEPDMTLLSPILKMLEERTAKDDSSEAGA